MRNLTTANAALVPLAPPRQVYDWTPIVASLRAAPGVWHLLSEPHSKVSRHGIRRGIPSAFSPAGAFDAKPRKEGTYLVFLGDPTEPWELWDDTPFELVARPPLPENATYEYETPIRRTTPDKEPTA